MSQEPKWKPFRDVLVICTQCKAQNQCRMQVDDGEYEWDCDNCMEQTPHTVQADPEFAELDPNA